MGLFTKKKITVEQIANTFTEMIASLHTHEQISELLKASGQEFVINDQQKKEITAFQMFTATHAIQAGFGQVLGSQELLDSFHQKMFNNISCFQSEQLDFEKFIKDRYQAYYKVLHSDSKDMGISVGACFDDYFFSHNQQKGGSGLLVIGSALLFLNQFNHTAKFIKEVLAKFEVVKEKQ
jgi:hypothetical protein